MYIAKLNIRGDFEFSKIFRMKKEALFFIDTKRSNSDCICSVEEIQTPVGFKW